MSATISFAFVVRTANVLTHSPVLGSFQFSQNAGKPKRRPVLHPDREGLLHLLALDRLPFEKQVNRHDAAAPSICVTKIGSVATVSAFALIGGGFGFSLHQYGIRPRFRRSSERSPVSRFCR
jgi:hypothetical protein